MLVRTAARALTSSSARYFSSSAARQTKVAVLGAGGGIGQPLSLLLKSDPLVTSLSLYDIRGAPGVAADINHIDTASDVRSVLHIFSPAIDPKFAGHRLCSRSA
jgi:malate dehydrogenase